MRHRKLWGLPVFLSLFLVGVGLATDFSGTYRAPTATLQLASAGEKYTGTLTLHGAACPVTARENADKLEGTFVSEGVSFRFDARLNGEMLALHSTSQSYELKRETTQTPQSRNPLDQRPQTPAASPPANPEETQTGPTGDAAIAALKDLGPVQVDPKRDWLMLVYLDGDNNLNDMGVYNIMQMERGLPDSGVEVIVLYARPIKKEKNGYIDHPCVFRIRPNKNPDRFESIVLKDLGAVDMADSRTLAAFIEGAVKTFPSRQHALFTWDHGGGWASLTVDENAPGKPNNFDVMDMPRFRAGLIDGMHAAGLKKWDLIAFDMCLMGQLEVAAQIHDLADVMIASETLEPGKGMPYTRVLEALGKGTLGGRRIGAAIVAEFDKFHKSEGQVSTTLSALDLSLFDEVNTRLNALTDKLIPAMPKNWSSVARSCFYGEQYAPSRDDFRHGKSALQSVDLLDVLKKCRSAMPDFPAEAEFKDLVQMMDRFVIANANSQRRTMSNGVAIYFPVIKDAYDPAYEKLEFAKISHWPRLFAALYDAQAKNDVPPKFGKIELVDREGKPAAAMMPLVGFATSIEVEGRNMVWVRDTGGVRDAEFGGVRILVLSYVLDDHFIEKITKGRENFGQDIDVIMPQLIDGVNKLKVVQYGMEFRMSNGAKTVDVMVDNSDLRDPTSFTVLANIEHPTLGDKPVRAFLNSDAVSLAVKTVTLLQTSPDGRTVVREFVPPADAVITPLFLLYKDDGSKTLCGKESLTWNKGLSFAIDLLPAGDYEEFFEAETMTGAKTTAHYGYKAEADERLIKAKQTWQGFASEMMLGDWDWILPTDPPKSIGTSMTIDATEKPFIYLATLHSKDDEGRPKDQKGLLILEIHDQPFFRLIMAPQGLEKPGVMIGPMWWTPQDGKGRVLTRLLALDINIYWVQKSGRGPGPVPPPPPPPPVYNDPPGWQRFADANQQVSIAIPPALVPQPQVVKQVRGAYPGCDLIAFDAMSGTNFEIIRFDGVNDFRQAMQLLVAGRQQLGIAVQLGIPQQSKIDGVDSVFVAGQATNNFGAFNSIGVNLIPTPKGIVAVNYSCPVFNVAAVTPTLQMMGRTIKVAR